MTDPTTPGRDDLDRLFGATEAIPAAEQPTEAMPAVPAFGASSADSDFAAPVIVDAAQGPQTPSGASRAWGGVLTAVRRHPTAWIASAVTAAFVLIGGGAFAAGAATPRQQAAALTPAVTTSTTPSQTPTATPTPTVRPTANPVLPATALKTCSVTQAAADGRLGTLEAQVLDAKTGQVLFDRNGATPAPTASVLKTITAAATLAALGPDATLATTVVKGAQPGQVVLVGGGDPTLSIHGGTYYQGAPTMDDLANQVKQAWAADPANAAQPITSVLADASLFGGPTWQPSWPMTERTGEGSTAPITALIADGAKQNPKALESPRSDNPVDDAGAAFAQVLGAQYGGQAAAPQGAAALGTVHSQPVSALLNQALLDSDNTVMETLARLTAIKEGTGNTFGAIQAGDVAALKTYGLDATSLTIVDGSGLSADNRVPPSFLTGIMIKVLNREQGLGLVYDSLPVAGQTGTLSASYGRFTGASSIAAGHVHAKTGWITNGYTLAGVVDAKDGTELSFAIFALGNVNDSAKAAIDALTAAIYTCGGNLSNS